MNGLNQSSFQQFVLQQYRWLKNQWLKKQWLKNRLRSVGCFFRSRSGGKRSLRLRLAAMGLVMVMAIAMTGCSLESFKKKDVPQVPRIVTSTISDPKTFNPITNDVSTIIFGLLYSSLVFENGETGELEPTLAESWMVSDDQKEIVFTLREGLKWSDGEPFTVDDILFTYNDILFNPKIPSGIRDILRIGEQGLFPSVTKVSDRQVKFAVPEPFAPFLRYAGGISIMPKHALEVSVNTLGRDGQPKFLSSWGTDTDPAKIIGNGPYRLVNYSPGQRMIFERNPYYWKNDTNPDGETQPHVERLIQQIVESIDSALLQFRSGGIDIMGLTPEQFSLLKRETKKGKFTIYNDAPRPGSSFITFNLNTGQRDGKPLVDPIKSRWFNSRDFRQAVAYSIDRQTMINNLYQGLGQPQNSPIAVQSPYYLKAGKQYDYQPEKAKQILLNAGFSYNAENQLIDTDGNLVRFSLITNSGNTLREKMGAQIKQDLAQIGIQVDFQPIAFNTLVDRAGNTLEWDCIMLGFGGGIEPNGGANVWKTEGTLHMFNQNVVAEGETPLTDRQVSQWEKDIEALYIKGAQELNDDQRKAIYGEAQMLIQENLPFIYLVNPLSLIAIRDHIQGVKYTARYSSPLAGALWNIDDLKLSAE